MSRALATHCHGVAGVINVLPFSCMPGTVVAAMAPVLRKSMDGVPWLDISFDGQGATNVNTRLEAFMHQSLQFHRRLVVPRQRAAAKAKASAMS
jgi:predicted nucleotide-binding protein (sugar kinase/HSP70/actin superfamily)